MNSRRIREKKEVIFLLNVQLSQHYSFSFVRSSQRDPRPLTVEASSNCISCMSEKFVHQNASPTFKCFNIIQVILLLIDVEIFQLLSKSPDISSDIKFR
jgi:hypothetical protein